MYERDLFANALLLESAAERDRYLEEVCAENPAMRERVLKLLQAEQNLGSFLESRPGLLDATADVCPGGGPDASGAVIGPYTLARQIGEGGFGVVYLAEQSAPLRRQVALKIIKPGMDTREVIARFEAERQALARMDHPHISKVFDCGATASGAPYFVMELVRGIPITDYCDQHRLTMRERLELFTLVCRAIQHAHHKGIIHRDIKPSNVLVAQHDGVAAPKVIDFGVSKAIDGQFSERAQWTGDGRIVGTPLYMSPEQAGINGLDVDTRTDVYSLGVLLYELLTGATPFERAQLKNLACDEMRRVIRDQEPPRPSTRISALGSKATTVSASRKTDPKSLTALLRHDLDWIVMKALEKDRERRYETANGFALDVQRYLNNQPVEAFPPSAVYRFGKFARRNRRSLATAASLLALLVAGVVVSVWQAVRATEAERVARAEAASSEAVIAFINQDLLAQSDPSHEPDRDLKVRDALDRASIKIEGRFPGDPRVEAAIRHAIGTSYLTLGESEKGERHLLKAVEIWRRQLGDEHRKTIVSTMHLAVAVCDQGRFQEAEQLHRRVLAIQLRLLGPEHPETLVSMMNLTAAIYEQGRYADAEQRTVELLDLQRRVLGAEHPNTLKSLMNLASLERVQGRAAAAETRCRELLPVQRRVLRRDHPDTLETLSILANAAAELGRHPEAESLHREVLGVRRRVLGAEHPNTLNSMNNLALAIFHCGRRAEAEGLRQQLLEIQRRTLGAEHPLTLQNMMNLANLIRARGDYATAEQLHQEVVASQIQRLGKEHPQTLNSMLNLSAVICAQGKHAEAERSCRELLETQTRALGAYHPSVLRTKMNLAVTIHKQRRFADAEQLRREILIDQTRALGAEHPDTLASQLNLANSINAQNRRGDAEAQYRATLEQMERVLGADHPHTLKCQMALANVVDALGRTVEAEQRYRQALDLQRRVNGREHPDTLHCLNTLAWFLAFSAPQEQRRPDEAVELAREALAHQPDRVRCHRTLGQALYRAGNFAEALQTLRGALQRAGPNPHDLLTLAAVQWQLNQKSEALAVYDPLRGKIYASLCLIRLQEEMESMIAAEQTHDDVDNYAEEEGVSREANQG